MKCFSYICLRHEPLFRKEAVAKVAKLEVKRQTQINAISFVNQGGTPPMMDTMPVYASRKPKERGKASGKKSAEMTRMPAIAALLQFGSWKKEVGEIQAERDTI
jgi:hypothetical protein